MAILSVSQLGYTSGSCVLLLTAANSAELSFTLIASTGVSSSRDSFGAPESTLVTDPFGQQPSHLRAARAMRLGNPAHLIHQAKPFSLLARSPPQPELKL
jgi:hypothetical protein